MKSDAQAFLREFPLERLYQFFTPGMWGYVITHKHELKDRPAPTLSYIDALYNTDGAAAWLIKTNLATVYQLSMTREPFNEQSANIAADMFLAHYGNICTPYMMSIYFGSYITDYKSQYSSSFDLQDIMRQFREKFLSQWNALIETGGGEVEENKPETGPVGTDGLKVLIRRWLAEGRDVRQSNLYKTGSITEKLLREI